MKIEYVVIMIIFTCCSTKQDAGPCAQNNVVEYNVIDCTGNRVNYSSFADFGNSYAANNYTLDSTSVKKRGNSLLLTIRPVELIAVGCFVQVVIVNDRITLSRILYISDLKKQPVHYMKNVQLVIDTTKKPTMTFFINYSSEYDGEELHSEMNLRGCGFFDLSN